MADKYVAYVGTYTHEKSVGIYIYDVDPETGVFKEKAVTEINNPSNLTISADGKILYSIADEGVSAYHIEKDGTLTKINQEWIGGMRGCHVRVDSQNRYLFLAGYHDGRVTMMKLNKDGSIAGIADGVFHMGIGKSVAEKRLDPHVSCVELTPDEKYLCAVDAGLAQIKIYEIDYQHGKLRLVDIVRCDIDSGPRVMRFSQDGQYVYLITEMSNEIHVFKYDDKNGVPEFERIQEIPLLIGVEEEVASGTNIKCSKSDDYVFASVDGLNAVVIYKRDAKTGLLTYLSHTYISGDFPKSFSILPDEKYFVSLNHDTNEIRCFRIDFQDGHCLMCNPPISIQKPNCIQIHKLVD